MNISKKPDDAGKAKYLIWLAVYSAGLVALVLAWVQGQEVLLAVSATGLLALVPAFLYKRKILPEGSSACLPKGERPDPATLEIILEDLPVAMIRLRADGTIEGVNGAARALLGRSDLVEKNFSDEVEGLGRSMRVRVEEALKGNGNRTTEMGRFLRNGKEVFL